MPGQQRRVTPSTSQSATGGQEIATDDQQPPSGDRAAPVDERCAAIAVSTEERCQRNAVDGTDYCPYHFENIEFELDPETTD